MPKIGFLLFYFVKTAKNAEFVEKLQKSRKQYRTKKITSIFMIRGINWVRKICSRLWVLPVDKFCWLVLYTVFQNYISTYCAWMCRSCKYTVVYGVIDIKYWCNGLTKLNKLSIYNYVYGFILLSICVSILQCAVYCESDWC